MNRTNAPLLFGALALLLAACGGGTATTKPAPAQPEAPTADPAASARLKAPGFRLSGNLVPLRYAAQLTVDPAQETFSGTIEIETEIVTPTELLWLNGRSLTVTEASVQLDGKTVPATVADTDSEEHIGLVVPEPIGPGTARIRISYTGIALEREYSGAFRQKEGGRWYLYTQFEAVDARRVFPCFDEPSYKVPWQLTITVPADQLAFANTPEVSVVDADNGGRTFTFAESKPLPSYLVAFAAGPFEIVDAGTAGRNKTPLRIITPYGMTDQARFAVATTGPLLELLENYFDIPYPYAKLDSIAVPSFFGAMENPGLITYAMGSILSRPAEESLSFYRRYASIAAHELAHQWFGDLVTMQWWDDLWLNEAFATWMATKTVHAWKPKWSVSPYEARQRELAMSADSLVSAGPIRHTVTSRGEVWGGGSAILYAKGSAVIDMFERWIGPDAFRAGMRDYMKTHAWGNATAADFLAALTTQSSPELAAAFSSFIDQPGVPLVTAALECNKGEAPKVSLSQARYLPAGSELPEKLAATRWQIPVCVRYGTGKRSSARTCVLLSEATASVELPGAKKCPTWITANDGAAGYYRVAYADGLLDELLFGDRGRRLNATERITTISDMSALVKANKLPAADAFTLVPRLLKSDTPNLVMATIDIVLSVDQHLVPTSQRENYARFIRKMFGKQAHKLGWAPKRGEAQDVGDLRPQLLQLVAIQGQDKQLVAEATALTTKWLDTGAGIDKDMVDAVTAIAAYHGDAALYDRFLAQARAAKDDRRKRQQAFAAMASFSDPEIVKRNLGLMLSDEFDFRDSARLMQKPLSRTGTREVAYQFITENYDQVIGKIPAFYTRYIVYVSASFCDESHIAEAQSFWGTKVATIPGGDKVLSDVVEQITSCAAYRTAQEPSIAKFLSKF